MSRFGLLLSFVALLLLLTPVIADETATDEKQRDSGTELKQGVERGEAGNKDRSRAKERQATEGKRMRGKGGKRAEGKRGDGKRAEGKRGERRPAEGKGKPEERPSEDRRMQMITTMLKRADVDSDGKISKEEAPERMKDRFDRIDANKDGFIDQEEQQRMLARVRQMMARGGGPGMQGKGRPQTEGAGKDGKGNSEKVRQRGKSQAKGRPKGKQGRYNQPPVENVKPKRPPSE